VQAIKHELLISSSQYSNFFVKFYHFASEDVRNLIMWVLCLC